MGISNMQKSLSDPAVRLTVQLSPSRYTASVPIGWMPLTLALVIIWSRTRNTHTPTKKPIKRCLKRLNIIFVFILALSYPVKLVGRINPTYYRSRGFLFLRLLGFSGLRRLNLLSRVRIQNFTFNSNKILK